MVFLDSIEQLLSSLSEASMIFQEGTLLCANPPAKSLLGGKTRLEALLGDKPIPDGAGCMECELGGSRGFLYLTPLSLEDGQALLARFIPLGAEENADAIHNLLSSVSHELRESTAIISMAVELLVPQLEDKRNAKLTSYLAMLSQHQRRLQRIAGNLGSFCDLVNDELAVELSKFDLVDLCSTLISEVASLGDNKDRKIRFRCTLPSLHTLGDMEKLKRILLALISNSMKHTAPDGEITLSLSQSNERILLHLTDNGSGIPAEILSRVFRSFESRPRYLAEGIGGTGLGLGLPLANGIARLHGGTLMLESRPGLGTKVTVTLRKWSEAELALHQEVKPYSPTAQRVLLTELADVLSHNEYMPQFLD